MEIYLHPLPKIPEHVPWPTVQTASSLAWSVRPLYRTASSQARRLQPQQRFADP